MTVELIKKPNVDDLMLMKQCVWITTKEGLLILRVSFTVPGDPRTKKNTPMMIKKRNLLLPSEAFRKYAAATKDYWAHQGALRLGHPIDFPVNVCAVYYMQTHRVVDLVGLLQGSLDLMVENGILKDDNCRIAATYDGSRVDYDKENPRVEITITSKE